MKESVRGRLGPGSSNSPSGHPTPVGDECLGSCIPQGWDGEYLGWPCLLRATTGPRAQYPPWQDIMQPWGLQAWEVRDWDMDEL